MISKIWIEGNLESCLRFAVNLKISVCHDPLSTGHGNYLLLSTSNTTIPFQHWRLENTTWYIAKTDPEKNWKGKYNDLWGIRLIWMPWGHWTKVFFISIGNIKEGFIILKSTMMLKWMILMWSTQRNNQKRIWSIWLFFISFYYLLGPHGVITSFSVWKAHHSKASLAW